MTATTINSFPSLHSWRSPRSWALAIIVLLHLGFFWALTHGLARPILKIFVPESPVYIPESRRPVVDEFPQDLDKIDLRPHIIKSDEPMPRPEFEEENTAPRDVIETPPGTGSLGGSSGGVIEPPAPVIVEPRIDTRHGLSEPYYPPQAIREGKEGTVLLALFILPDGRVGEVKLERSSGVAKLDESAQREAKKWRFLPGTRDGVAAGMWKKVPVTFRLNNR